MKVVYLKCADWNLGGKSLASPLWRDLINTTSGPYITLAPFRAFTSKERGAHPKLYPDLPVPYMFRTCCSPSQYINESPMVPNIFWELEYKGSINCQRIFSKPTENHHHHHHHRGSQMPQPLPWFKRKMWVPLGEYPSSRSKNNITRYCPFFNHYITHI